MLRWLRCDRPLGWARWTSARSLRCRDHRDPEISLADRFNRRGPVRTPGVRAVPMN